MKSRENPVGLPTVPATIAEDGEQPPLVSVLIPARNEEDYLSEMLASLAAQSYPHWEAILVDDGSIDQTPNIMRDWASRDDRFRIASVGTRLGKVLAFNLAFRCSRGSIICHVGGDDLMPTDSLEARRLAFKGTLGRTVVLGKLQVIDSNGRSLGQAIPRGTKGSQSGPGSAFSRRLADEIFPVPVELPSEDIWLGYAAVGCASEVIHIREIVTKYRVHSENSNPRSKPFNDMTESIHRRMAALQLLLDAPHLPLRHSSRSYLQERCKAEAFRYNGQVLRILGMRHLPLADRLAIATMSQPLLWALRQRLGHVLSGWRKR